MRFSVSDVCFATIPLVTPVPALSPLDGGQALLSRFDLLWLLLDESSKEQDTRLANHIVRLHVTGR